ncbi:uncharacterized protein [Paramisgurnus dabryanus]|uniref:uncharacterized protein n=1 Tax=Paramisgurnus dabryanus TaxID=90735 RepID=UPI003CCF6D09
MRSGSSVTLTCQLFTFDNTCNIFVSIEDLQMFWMNQADVNLQTDPRYQILSSGPCIITLSTILLNEDNNREWRCLVKMKNEIKTSFSYIVKFTRPTKTYAVTAVTPINTERRSTLNSPVTPIHHSQASTTTTTLTQTVSVREKTSSPTAPSAPKQQVPVIAAVIAAVVFLFAGVLLGVICLKRSRRRQADIHLVTEKGSNDTIIISNIPEQKDDVTYSEVITSGEKQQKNKNVYSAEKVTYAAIRGEVEVQKNCTELYASVNKTSHKQI